MAKDSKSKKFVSGLKKRKDVKSPEGLGAFLGRKNLGGKNFQKRATAGKKSGK